MSRFYYSARWPLSTLLPVCMVAPRLRCTATNTTGLGSFNAYAHRFFSPSYSVALSYNYWFNDAVSVASDLVAAQILLQFWTTWHPWVISLVFWVFLVVVNAVNVGAYGELGKNYRCYTSPVAADCTTAEYWLASLKVLTIVLFVIVGIVVNVGGNTSHEYIGSKNWRVGDAPFVGGFRGFTRVFVTASFACECSELYPIRVLIRSSYRRWD
jgi:AAT family amino acid transporter